MSSVHNWHRIIKLCFPKMFFTIKQNIKLCRLGSDKDVKIWNDVVICRGGLALHLAIWIQIFLTDVTQFFPTLNLREKKENLNSSYNWNCNYTFTRTQNSMIVNAFIRRNTENIGKYSIKENDKRIISKKKKKSKKFKSTKMYKSTKK